MSFIQINEIMKSVLLNFIEECAKASFKQIVSQGIEGNKVKMVK